MVRKPLVLAADLTQARRQFFDRGWRPAGEVPETILDSWTRCQRLGLPVNKRAQIEPVATATLKQIRERNERLWRLARGELDYLAADARATGSMVILTDAHGWILDADGDREFLDKAGRVSLAPGACWEESQVGTNAIGTAIVEGRALEVRGGEHYKAPHGILSCSASPIFDPFGQMLGVLDITGDARAAQDHALALAQLAAANIEHRYFEEGIEDCQILRVHADRALLGSAREGVLAFRDGLLVAANQAGLALFELPRTALGKVPFAQLFADRGFDSRQLATLLDRDGRPLHGRWDSDQRRRSATHRRVDGSARGAEPDNADQPLFDANLIRELARANRVLAADLPVLLRGETGTGKEVFAREMHRRSERADKPFVAVNCAALPEGLIEAELFGYEEGAFTGARRSGNPGLLRQAEGGVLFLDEIGDMPLALQPRLLRVLQERELTALGGGKPIRLDFALICATHQDLPALIEQGRFRADLYYRIAHHEVQIAPLREVADRAALIERLWRPLADGRLLEAEVLAAMSHYQWPGNWRQLSACLRTIAALSDPGERIGIDSLPSYLVGIEAPNASAAVAPGPTDLQQQTELAMRYAIEQCNGNVTEAARQLGISRSTLYRRLGAGRLRD